MKKVIIIGGGVAGLSAGITAQKMGYKSEIIEKTHTAGGNLCGWDRNGFHIDNCLHWLTGTNEKTELYRLWKEYGALNDGIVQLPFLYKSTDGTNEVTFHFDTYRAEAEFSRLSPIDERRIHGFFDAVRVSMRMQVGSATPLDRLKYVKNMLFYGREDLFSFAAGFSHPLLCYAFTDFIGGEFSTLALIYAYAAFASGNGALPRGGSRKMASEVEKTYLRLGGTLTLGTPAEEITVENGRAIGVRLANGEVKNADAFLLACDPAVTFAKLLPETPIPRQLLSMYRRRNAFPIYSSFHTAFAVDSDSLPFRCSTVVSVPPFFSDGRQISRLFLREFSHEPSFAPKGKQVVQTMFFLHEPECRRWLSLSRDKERYENEKRALSETLRDAFVSAYPSLSGKVSILDTWTPATYHRYFGGFYGAYLGFGMTGKALPVTASPKVDGISNLLLATQWLESPGGLPIAALQGRRSAKMLPEILK